MFGYPSLAVVLAVLLLSGCASTSPQASDPDLYRTFRRVLVRIPEGLPGEKCWDRAQKWIGRHGFYLVDGNQGSAHVYAGRTVYGFSVTPVRMHTLGGDTADPEPTTGAGGIELRLECGTYLSQCVPGPDEVIRAFAEYVRTGNDRFRFHKQEWVSIR